MVQIDTILGYGFHIPRDKAVGVKSTADEYLLRPMCNTCGQSPYFFGLILQTINSKQAYIEFDLSEIAVKDLNGCMTRALNEEYEKTFGRKPPFDPRFMMFTDMKVV